MQPSGATDAKFRRAFDERFDAVNRYCLRRLSPDDANDAAALVFVVAWRKVRAMPEGDGTLPWLYGIAHYEVSTMRRGSRRRTALHRKLIGQAQEHVQGPSGVVVRRAERRGSQGARLIVGYGPEVILLRSYEDLSTGEMAVVLDCSHEAAKKRLPRALKRLRKAAGLPGPSPSASPSRAIQEGGNG